MKLVVFFAVELAFLLSSVSLSKSAMFRVNSAGNLVIPSSPPPPPTPSQLPSATDLLESTFNKLLITNVATSKSLIEGDSGLSSQIYPTNSTDPDLPKFQFFSSPTSDSPHRYGLRSNSGKYITLAHDFDMNDVAPEAIFATLTADGSNTWSCSTFGENVAFQDHFGYYLCASDASFDFAIIGTREFSDLCKFSLRGIFPILKPVLGSRPNPGNTKG